MAQITPAALDLNVLCCAQLLAQLSWGVPTCSGAAPCARPRAGTSVRGGRSRSLRPAGDLMDDDSEDEAPGRVISSPVASAASKKAKLAQPGRGAGSYRWKLASRRRRAQQAQQAEGSRRTKGWDGVAAAGEQAQQRIRRRSSAAAQRAQQPLIRRQAQQARCHRRRSQCRVRTQARRPAFGIIRTGWAAAGPRRAMPICAAVLSSRRGSAGAAAAAGARAGTARQQARPALRHVRSAHQQSAALARPQLISLLDPARAARTRVARRCAARATTGV